MCTFNPDTDGSFWGFPVEGITFVDDVLSMGKGQAHSEYDFQISSECAPQNEVP